MKYILLNDSSVAEIIPEFDPVFPGIPIEKRYAPDFLSSLIPVEDDVEVESNDIYDVELGTFSKPVPPSPDDDPDQPIPDDPPAEHQTYTEKLDSLTEENTLLKAQIKAQTDRSDFLEDCIAEMAMLVYAE